MNIKQFRHFVAVAEECHFSRAAARLNMAQPPLSQSISRLESDLGFPLFVRAGRNVSLTPAGEGLLQEVRPALQQLDHAVQTAKRIQTVKLPTISIGFVGGAIRAVLPEILHEVQRLTPDCAMKLHMMSTERQRRALLDGAIDIGVMFPEADESPRICCHLIERSRFFLMVQEHSPLARRDRVTPDDLQDQPLIYFPPGQRPELHAALLAECWRRGFKPRLEVECTDYYSALGLVAAGIGMAVTYEPLAAQAFPGVKYIPLDGFKSPLKQGLSLAWIANPAPSLDELIRSITRKFDAKNKSSRKALPA